MSETHLIRDVLADPSHEAHSAATTFTEKLISGEISMCGCIGPMYGEPYCACQMKQRSLEAEMNSNPLRQSGEDNAQKDYKELIRTWLSERAV